MTATLKQARHLLKVVDEKSLSGDQLANLHDSGLFTDLVEAAKKGLGSVDRTVYRHILGLPPRLEDGDTSSVVHVDRSFKPSYPDWVQKVMHLEVEATGPTEYDLGKLEQWLHDDQKGSHWVKGERIYEHLKRNDMLESCLGLRDLEEIQKKGIKVFRKHFAGKAVFGWKSVVQDRGGYLLAPCLYERGGEVVLRWLWLDGVWGSHYPAARFAK